MRQFTPRQVLVLVLVICATIVLTPATVVAAGSLMTLVDPSTGSKARVDAGRLRVGDGSGPLTVDGAVRAVPQLPATPVFLEGSAADTAPDTLVTQRHGRGRLALGTLTATALVYSSSTAPVRGELTWMVVNGSSETCPQSPAGWNPPSGTREVHYLYLTLPQDRTTALTYPVPLTMFGKSSSSTTSCLWLGTVGIAGTQYGVNISLTGAWY